MFNALGNILNVQPRTAEQTDTRQALQHHDPEYHRREKKKDDKRSDEFDEFTNAILSVEALRVFLQKLLKTSLDRRKNSEPYEGEDRRERGSVLQNTENPQSELSLQENPRQKSAQAARAAYAYQSTQHAKNKENILLETTDQGTGPELDLSASDVRTVHELLEQLRVLSENEIEYLQIDRAETFLVSLQNSIQRALKAIPQN